MSDVDRQIAELPVEGRRTLAALLRARIAVAPPRAESPSAGAPGANHGANPGAAAGGAEFLQNIGNSTQPDGVRASFKRFYDSVSTQLDASEFGAVSYFLNYGYVSMGGPDWSVLEPPPHTLNANSMRLVLELVGDCRIDGMRVLDVGCGRGGTLHTLKTFFRPAALTGLDLSTAAITFNRRAHGDDTTRFYEGDAEKLPFRDESVDVVTNVESSHSYPRIERFYSEVHRVLAPGGAFLYTDLMTSASWTSCRAFLSLLGFEAERQRDITVNVLRSCDQVGAHRVAAFDRRNDQTVVENFLAAPGSDVYELMRTSRMQYRMFRLRKPPKESVARGLGMPFSLGPV